MSDDTAEESATTVSVVVPTIGRAHLVRAVRSVLAQTHREIELLVVADGADAAERARAQLPDDPRLRLLEVPERQGAAHARNVGTEAARGDLVAYLDDDDMWEVDKLAIQLTAARFYITNGERFVMTCASWFVRTAAPPRIYPRRDLPHWSQVGNYLVERDRPWFGNTMVQTSSLVLDRATATEVRWDERLPKHQDWDFVIRAAVEARCLIGAGPIPLVWVSQGSEQSISMRPDWRDSLVFLDLHPDITGRSRLDFLTTFVVAAAVEQGDLAGLRAARERWRGRARVPHAGSTVVVGRGLVRSTRRVGRK